MQDGEITSQGMRRDEALLDAKVPRVNTEPVVIESTRTIVEQEKAAAVAAEGSTSVLGGLWSQIRAATEAVAHIAQGAAVAVEHAGEKVVEQTKELALEVEHTAEVKTGQLLELGSDLQAKAQTALADAGQKLHDLSEVIAHDVAEEAKETAAALLSSDAAQTAKSAGNEAFEQVKSLGEQVVAAGTDAIERVKTEGVTAEAKELGQQTMSAGEIFIEQAQAQLNNLAEQATAFGQQVLASTEGGIPLARSDSKKMKKSASSRSVGSVSDAWNGEPLVLTMDVVSHVQRIADRTGDALLHDTARKAHSACAKGLNEAPGVHLVWITPQQANDLVNLAIRTQDHELADFARYCQSVAATTHIGVEPSPGKIQQEILKGQQELQSQGRVHTGPGYGAAFASVNKTYTGANKDSTMVRSVSAPSIQTIQKPTEQPALTEPPQLVLDMDVVSHIQRIADRTGNSLLHDTARKAHSACAKGLSDAPGVHLVWITPQQASELMNLASRTQGSELIDFARYCQSVAATTQVGVEPEPGKIQQEILKGRQDVQKLVQLSAVTGESMNAAM